VNATRARTAVTGLAAAGLFAGLSLAGSELPWIALACAIVILAIEPRWLPRLDIPAALVAITWLLSARLSGLAGANALPTLTCVAVVCGAARLPLTIARPLLAACLAIAVLVLALVAAYGAATIGEPRLMTYPGLEGWGGYPEMGLLGVMALPLAMSLAVGAGPPAARAGAAVAAAAAAAGVMLSGSRAAWAAAVLAAVLVLFSRSRLRWRSAVAITAGAAVLTTVLVVAAVRLEGVSMGIASGSRLEAWSQATELWRERPLIGWGPATYHRAYATRHYDQPTDAQFHAHSEYLHVAVETGVLGAASALWFALAVIAGMRRRAAPGAAMIAAARRGLVCGLIAVAARALVDYFDPAGAAMRAVLWLSILAGLRVALDAAPDAPADRASA